MPASWRRSRCRPASHRSSLYNYISEVDGFRYARLLSAFRPCVDLVLSGLTARDATDATRRIFRTLQESAPNESIRVLLQRVAVSRRSEAAQKRSKKQ